jgi:hypothetical protein
MLPPMTMMPILLSANSFPTCSWMPAIIHETVKRAGLGG